MCHQDVPREGAAFLTVRGGSNDIGDVLVTIEISTRHLWMKLAWNHPVSSRNELKMLEMNRPGFPGYADDWFHPLTDWHRCRRRFV